MKKDALNKIAQKSTRIKKRNKFVLNFLDMLNETSKLMLFTIIIVAVIFAVVILIGWYNKLEDAAEFFQIDMWLIIFVVSFYMWKAKAENIEKIKKRGVLSEDMLNKLLEKSGDDLANFFGFKNTTTGSTGKLSDDDAVG